MNEKDTYHICEEQMLELHEEFPTKEELEKKLAMEYVLCEMILGNMP